MDKDNPLKIGVGFISAALLLMIIDYLIIINPEFLVDTMLGDIIISLVKNHRETITYTFIGLSIVTWMVSGYSQDVTKKIEKSVYSKFVALIIFVFSLFVILTINPGNVVLYRILWPIAILSYLFHGFIISVLFKKPREDLEDEFSFKPTKVLHENEFSFNWKSDKGEYINVVNPFQGNLIIGGAGAGKSYTLIKPMIKTAVEKHYTGVLYDFKAPELTEYLVSCFKERSKSPEYKKWMKAHGLTEDKRKIRIVNLRNPNYSHRINPISPKYMEEISFANEYAITILLNINKEWITKRDFFANNAIAYLAGIFWYLKSEFPDQCTLPHAVTIALQNSKRVLTMLRANDEVAGIIATLTTAMDNKAEGQIAGAVSSLQDPVRSLFTPEMFWILSGNDFSLSLNDPDDPAILCLSNDAELEQTYSPVLSLIATVCMKLMNKKKQRHSMFMLDEAPTIYIPSLSKLPATGRSSQIATIYCAQDISQLESQMDDKKAREIIGNLGNQFWGMVNDVKTAETVSKTIGKREKLMKSLSDSKSKGASKGKTEGENQSLQMHELIRPDQVMGLKVGQFVGKVTAVEEGESNIFNVKPSITPVKDSYESKIIAECNNERIEKDRMREVMKRNFDKIIKESKELVDAMSRFAVNDGYGVEEVIFPEHFNQKKQRVLTIWGSPFDGSDDESGKESLEKRLARVSVSDDADSLM